MREIAVQTGERNWGDLGDCAGRFPASGSSGMDAGQLRREVSRVVSDPESSELGRLDLLLTDCAATTLRLSAESSRVERELDAALARGPEAGHETEPLIRALVRRSRQLAAERRQLGELMQELRALRDLVAGGSAST